MVIENSIPIHVGTDRSSNNTHAMTVNTDNTVTVHTSCFNNSDSKLNHIQHAADHTAIKRVFDAIDVETYTRTDKGQQ